VFEFVRGNMKKTFRTSGVVELRHAASRFEAQYYDPVQQLLI